MASDSLSSGTPTRTEFRFLLNAMENAAAQEVPFNHGYASKRVAVLAHVQELEERVRRLEEALRRFLNAAESWHKETGHEDDDPIIKCDAICECMGEARAALREPQTEQEGK